MKRAMDILLVLLALPIWLPLFLVTLMVVLICHGRPVFFFQERAGFRGKPFRIIKFRTMRNVQDATGNHLPDEDRLTTCGRRLRDLSLDELPELLNILKGEMSLVGPRPLPTVYVPRYSPDQARRLDCLPGLTGWAQVNGRNLLDWESRFQHDVWYVSNRSFWLDIRILALTILTVVKREGISADNVATMTEFMGSEPVQGQEPRFGSSPPCSPDPSRRSES
jgi:lipopolysaccharide/colanic/teichoic acid biosynthesis glycosyltransferase